MNIQEKINDLQRQLDELKNLSQQPDEWPKLGDTYYHIGSSPSKVFELKWGNTEIDNARKNGLGIFKEERVAQYYFERFKLLREIDEFCDAKNPKGWNMGVCIFGLQYDREDSTVCIEHCGSTMPLYGCLKERSHAEELLKLFGERIIAIETFKR